MKIAVCMKQVPAASEGNMDPVTGVLIRTGLEAIVNVYDMAALEAALRIKEAVGGTIHVYTMGPSKAEALLREAFAMGADEGWLICDRLFAGADVLATSYTISRAIQHAQTTYDLILCGKQTTDGDTAQVSGELAQWLGIPHINWVTSLIPSKEGEMQAVYNMENRKVTARVQLPCLFSVEKEDFLPRMPSLKLRISGKKKPITILTAEDLQEEGECRFGLTGSATKVKKIFPPPVTQRQPIVQINGKEASQYLYHIMNETLSE